MSCPTTRTHPLCRPPNHQPPIPRWRLSIPDQVKQVFVSYIGIEEHGSSEAATYAKHKVVRAIQHWITASFAVSESFTTIRDSHDLQPPTTIWVCYWSDPAHHTHALSTLDLRTLHHTLDTSIRPSIGLWHETFATSTQRLETNYSGLDYLPGLAKLSGTTTASHDLSTYWGAARDRIPDSAHDLFPRPAPAAAVRQSPPHPLPQGLGQHLKGTNRGIANMVHIRSGQYWQNCGQRETDAYETKLEPSLRAGMQYLSGNKAKTGTLCMRYMQNEHVAIRNGDGDGGRVDRKESCGAGFLTNLEDLESWAKSHKSHVKIWSGAMAHYKAFGEERKFRTWHEVCVVKAGDATFEYVNCLPSTGVIESVELDVENL